MAATPLSDIGGGGGGGLFSGSVADLFATLGLDSSGLSEGLRRAKVDLSETSKNVLTLTSLLAQLQKQAGPQVAVAAFAALNAQLQQSTRSLFAWQNQVTSALRNANMAMQQQAAATAAATGAPTLVGAQAGGGGSTMLLARLTERFLIYQGLRMAVQGVTSALHEADDITRRMDQIGWGSAGVQRLQLQVERLHMPVDQVTSAIARFEQKMDSGDLSAVKALDRLGLRFDSVRKQMSANPQAGLEGVLAAMNRVGDQGAFSDAAFALFQDRSGKMLGFIREYKRLKEDAEKTPILSEEDRKAVENLNLFLQRVQQMWSVGIGRLVGAFLRAPTVGFGNLESQLVSQAFPTPAGLAGLHPIATHTIGPIASHGGTGAPSTMGAANSPESASTDTLNRLLDEFRAPHELAMRKLNDDWQTMLLLERQGLATHGQVIEFQRRASMKLTEEAQAAIDAMIKRDVALLTEFGAQGKRTSESMTKDFQELSRVFRANRISVEEMTEATANYFGMLEDNAARPALREAIRMFEQGLIGPEELLKARERARALGARGEAETAFERGEIGPEGLMGAQRRYRGALSDFAPDRGQRFFLGPGGSILTEPKRDRLPLISPSDVRGPQGSLNIVPLDQFSEQMLRRWKQQGY